MKHALALLIVLLLAACRGGQPAPHEGAISPPGQSARPDAAAAPSSTPAGSSLAGPDIPVSSPASTAEGGDEALARIDGYGDLRFGMRAEQARTAWGGQLLGDEVKPDNCAYLRPKGAKTGAEFGLMFEGGRFMRYDIGHAREAAPGGGRVGMTRRQIETLYPSLEVQPHHYVPGAHYLRVAQSPSATNALVFETDAAGTVARWRAGRVPQVDYVEGCA